MSACEKCWREAGGDAERYSALIGERRSQPCSAEEQAGERAEECPWCGRKTLHELTREPMCGCPWTPARYREGHPLGQ